MDEVYQSYINDLLNSEIAKPKKNWFIHKNVILFAWKTIKIDMRFMNSIKDYFWFLFNIFP